MKQVDIAGKNYVLTDLDEISKRQAWVEARISFEFFLLEYKGMNLLVLEAKDGIHYSPRNLRLIAQRIYSIYQMPAVFLLSNLSNTDRNRLIDQDVYFIVSGKYFFLPNLLINSRETKIIQGDLLTPAAQWVILSYLQGIISNNQTADEIAAISPYKYTYITLAIRLLESHKLCSIEIDSKRCKHLVFDEDKAALFERAKPCMLHPIRERIYCDDIVNYSLYKFSGITALAHYTALNPEEMQTIAISASEWRGLDKASFVGLNPYEGKFCIEIWKYEPVGSSNKFVDKLSLALSLQDDIDPRVNKEVEQLIENIW